VLPVTMGREEAAIVEADDAMELLLDCFFSEDDGSFEGVSDQLPLGGAGR